MFRASLLDIASTGVLCLCWLMSSAPSRGLMVLAQLILLVLRLSLMFWLCILAPTLALEILVSYKISEAFVLLCQLVTLIVCWFCEQTVKRALNDPRLVALQVGIHPNGIRIRKFFDKQIGFRFNLFRPSSDMCPICLDELRTRRVPNLRLSAAQPRWRDGGSGGRTRSSTPAAAQQSSSSSSGGIGARARSSTPTPGCRNNFRLSAAQPKPRKPTKVMQTNCCKRTFHLECINKWLNSTSEEFVDPSCPICRRPLQEVEEVDFSIF